MLLPEEAALAQELSDHYCDERSDVVEAAFSLFDEKGKKYDVHVPFWHRHKDPGAFVHELEKKVGRLAQVHEADIEGFVATPDCAAFGESVLEQLLDIVNYACMLHWTLTTSIEQIDEANSPSKGPSRFPETAEAVHASPVRVLPTPRAGHPLQEGDERRRE